MEIRKAGIADLPRMMEIYSDARAYMRKHGNATQWAGGYPSEERIREDIGAGESYVCVENGEYWAFSASLSTTIPLTM